MDKIWILTLKLFQNWDLKEYMVLPQKLKNFSASIEIQTMGSYPMFDQKQLDRFHNNEKLLPENAVIVNDIPTSIGH